MNRLKLDFVRMAWPTDWAQIYGRRAPLVIEIGFGNGRYLVDQALQRSDLNFLGIEIASPSLNRAENRIHRSGTRNVRLIKATAQSVLQTLCRPGTVQSVTVNFPDPWPKAGHAGRRLISTSFLELLASRMATGADLEIATDHAGYGEWIAERLQDSPYFESRLDEVFIQEDRRRLQTKYELKGLAAGSSCFYFKWRRNSTAGPDGYPLVQELPMPHVIARCPLSLQEIAAAFEPRLCAEDGLSVRLIDLYISQGRPLLVVDAYISEQPVAQRLMLELNHRPDGDYLIRLAATGFPRATAGVHMAIACLVDWLCGLHAEATVVRHNLRRKNVGRGAH